MGQWCVGVLYHLKNDYIPAASPAIVLVSINVKWLEMCTYLGCNR